MADFSKLMERKAAALKYDSEKNGAPMIVAAGMGHMAEKITETAMKAGVPVYEDDSLASLLTQMKLGAEIPEELFQAIVEIYIYFLGFTGDAEKDKEEQEKRREERRIRELQKNDAGQEEQSGQEKETKIRERLSS